ncbi:UTRA domain-containing protein [Enterococcus faecium]|uniref:UTRA domain-containing protein n=1 Tax=Enterococcus faecium TaxID=1352 RepID=UPI003133B0C7
MIDAPFSLYEVYEFYGIKLSEAEQTLEVVELDKREAKLLKIENDKTGLLIECKTYNENHRLIEYSKNFTRRDISDYTVQFGKY